MRELLMTPERLAEIEERLQAATEGPWWSDESELVWRLHGVAFRTPPQLGGEIGEQIVNKQIAKAPKKNTSYAEYWPEPADDAFITHAWQDITDLLAEVKRLSVPPFGTDTDHTERLRSVFLETIVEMLQIEMPDDTVERLARQLSLYANSAIWSAERELERTQEILKALQLPDYDDPGNS